MCAAVEINRSVTVGKRLTAGPNLAAVRHTEGIHNNSL